MEEKLKKVKQILEAQNQEHLLKFELENNEKLIDEILSIDFEQLNNLYQKAINKEEINAKKIEPISYVEKDKLSEEQRKKYEQIGEKIIKDGKYAAVTMAGGQRNKIRA